MSYVLGKAVEQRPTDIGQLDFPSIHGYFPFCVQRTLPRIVNSLYLIFFMYAIFKDCRRRVACVVLYSHTTTTQPNETSEHASSSHSLWHWWANYGPRAKSSPRSYFILPPNLFNTSMNIER